MTNLFPIFETLVLSQIFKLSINKDVKSFMQSSYKLCKSINWIYSLDAISDVSKNQTMQQVWKKELDMKRFQVNAVNFKVKCEIFTWDWRGRISCTYKFVPEIYNTVIIVMYSWLKILIKIMDDNGRKSTLIMCGSKNKNTIIGHLG